MCPLLLYQKFKKIKKRWYLVGPTPFKECAFCYGDLLLQRREIPFLARIIKVRIAAKVVILSANVSQKLCVVFGFKRVNTASQTMRIISALSRSFIFIPFSLVVNKELTLYYLHYSILLKICQVF